MSEKTQRSALGLFILVIFLQVLDVVIHLATSQVEPLRLLSIGVLTAALIATRFPARRNYGFFGPAIGIYLAFNLIFVLQNGLTNNVSGEPRVILVILVTASCVSSYIYGRSILKGVRR